MIKLFYILSNNNYLHDTHFTCDTSFILDLSSGRNVWSSCCVPSVEPYV